MSGSVKSNPGGRFGIGSVVVLVVDKAHSSIRSLLVVCLVPNKPLQHHCWEVLTQLRPTELQHVQHQVSPSVSSGPSRPPRPARDRLGLVAWTTVDMLWSRSP